MAHQNHFFNNDSVSLPPKRWWGGRQRGGLRCSSCGIQTHKRKRFSLFRTKFVPLTLEHRVMDGNCLRCNDVHPRREARDSSSTIRSIGNDSQEIEREDAQGERDESDRLLTNLLLLLALMAAGDEEEENEAEDIDQSETAEQGLSTEETLEVLDEEPVNAQNRFEPLQTIREHEPLPDNVVENSGPLALKCAICLCSETDESEGGLSRRNIASINGCEHRFCFGCIEEWAEHENTCPLCKTRFTRISSTTKNGLSPSSDTSIPDICCKEVQTRNQEPAEDELLSISLGEVLADVLTRLLLEDNEDDSTTN